MELPGIKDPERIKNLIGKTAKITFRLVSENSSEFGSDKLVTVNGEELIVSKRIIISGENLIDSQPRIDSQSNQPNVSFTLDRLGAQKFGRVTTDNVGKRIAIVLDNKIISAPSIREPITGGSGSISGNFSFQDTTDLALLLRSGALPTPLKIVEERSVGPDLGKDSIKSGTFSLLIGFMLVILFMLYKYRYFGVVANISLIANLLMLVGILTILEATLTLPGIAGIILTVGMAVDANVLIFERIKEELRTEKSIIHAFDTGYNKAKITVIDANVTTLLTAIVLGYFGTGAIQGFAVTLIIGIFTSLFSALIISRLIFSYMIERKKDISFSTSITKNLFLNLTIPFIKKRKTFYIISALIIAGGLFSMVQRSLDYGVEFTGGRTFKVEFDKAVNLEDVKSKLTASFGDQPEVKMVDNEFKALITTQFMLDDKSADGSQIVEAKLAEGLKMKLKLIKKNMNN